MTAPASPPRVAAVVLAAGGSTRLGHPKQLVPVRGEPLVRRAARAALGAGAEPVVVVLGAHADLVRPALHALPVRTVTNDRWATGLASSLAAGLRAALAGDACDGVLVTLVDQPLVDAGALRRLLARFDATHRLVASAYEHTVGVPAVFGREHLDALLQLTGDAGAGGWLRRRIGEVTPVPLGVAALDVDTPAEVARLDASGGEPPGTRRTGER